MYFSQLCVGLFHKHVHMYCASQVMQQGGKSRNNHINVMARNGRFSMKHELRTFMTYQLGFVWSSTKKTPRQTDGWNKDALVPKRKSFTPGGKTTALPHSEQKLFATSDKCLSTLDQRSHSAHVKTCQEVAAGTQLTAVPFVSGKEKHRKLCVIQRPHKKNLMHHIYLMGPSRRGLEALGTSLRCLFSILAPLESGRPNCISSQRGSWWTGKFSWIALIFRYHVPNMIRIHLVVVTNDDWKH